MIDQEKPLLDPPTTAAHHRRNATAINAHGQRFCIPLQRLTTSVKLAVVVGFVIAIGVWIVIVIVDALRQPSACAGSVPWREFSWDDIAPTEDLVWQSCFEGLNCTKLRVPMDYRTPSGPKVDLAMAMKAATDKANYKGTILINPGGPGGSGVSIVQKRAEQLSNILGPSFDILGFDPRGVGASKPYALCFSSQSEYKIWMLNDKHLNSSEPSSIRTAMARENVLGEICRQTIGGTHNDSINATAEDWGIGHFVTTPYVVEDMVRISDKLGQEKLNYWGFSYGTILGQYFIAMHPDKVGRIALDGNYYAGEYIDAQKPSDLVDTPDVAKSFFEFCYRGGPEKCPLYASSPEAVEARVERIFQSLRDEPVAVPFTPSGPGLVTDSILREIYFEAMYRPLAAFDGLATALLAVETNNQTRLAEVLEQSSSSFACDCGKKPKPWASESPAFQAIACGDSVPVNDTYEEFMEYYYEMETTNPFVAPIWAKSRLMCAGWKIEPKWRFTGPFEADDTSNPILILNPLKDPVCPLSHAKIVQAKYPNSGLLTQLSVGHCTINAPSLCTAKAVRAYFENGTLPKEGAECDVDEIPFVGRVDSARVLSVEDEELLDSLRVLSREEFGIGSR